MRARSLNAGTPGGATQIVRVSGAILMRVTAAFEGATGAALLFMPASMSMLLFGERPDAPLTELLFRLFGAPLVSLAIVCWAASGSGRAEAPHVAAMLLYNVIVAALLLYAGAGLGFIGVALWPAAGTHVLLAGWCVAELQKGGRAAKGGVGSR